MDGFKKSADGRPNKRRRVDNMTAPEGFQESGNPKPVHKPSVPQFQSAFGNIDTAPQPKSKSKDTTRTKPAAKKPLSHTGLQDTSISRDAMKASTSRRVDTPPLAVQKPLKITSAQDLRKEFVLNIPQKPKPQLRHAPRPPPLMETNVPKPLLHQIVAPSFPAPKPSSKVLQPLHPPTHVISTSRNNLQPSKDLRTISSAEYGAEDLASILLRDQSKGLYAHAGDDITRRGLELSPERKNKDGTGKFIRGGLAARAATHFDRTRTSFVLWRRQKELERTRTNAIPSGVEFCASVLKILHRSPPPPARPTASTPPTTVIALCRIYQPNGDAHASFKADHLYKVVFSCPDLRASETGLEALGEGQSVRVYQPWHSMGASQDKAEGAGAKIPRLPASLPLPCSEPFSTPNPLNAPTSDTTLFCSRYFIS
ncbi:hypothetical protein BDN70DRAFT_434468 [Pholiota conissans]|uniref:Uncharacterized protein n=1 Tax=Pholiota conissans TaxID=109636 RepID=A0A9P5YQF3_9AGAR|nr:hypothetical protein BDN70DRAFT_434468 [Pholiota conissans]